MKTLNIFDYNELNENSFYNRVAAYIIVVLIIIFISIIVLLKIKKNVYYSNRLFIANDTIVTNISIDDLDKVTNHQYMFINNDLVKYDIKNIELINDVITYYHITLSLDTNKKNRIGLRVENDYTIKHLDYYNKNLINCLNQIEYPEWKPDMSQEETDEYNNKLSLGREAERTCRFNNGEIMSVYYADKIYNNEEGMYYTSIYCSV